MSRIVYACHDGALHVSDLSGSSFTVTTPPGVRCMWPAWSPDGGHIAFSGIRSGSNGQGGLAVYLSPPSDGPPRLVYANEPDTDAIARQTPHYTLWSPDGRRLAFIAQTLKGGLTLFLYDTDGSGPAERLIDGAPLYLSWSHDSSYLLVHSVRAHQIVELAGEPEVRQVPGVSSLYMAPSCSPVASHMAMFRDSGIGHQTLLVADVATGAVRTLLDLPGAGAFAWAPDGKSLGLLRDVEPGSGYYPGLWLIGVDEPSERRITDDRVLSFFWSPEGARIAYITPSVDAEGSVRWAVASLAGAPTRYLVDFRPTQEQLTTFMFFDQYGQSASPWSPDGRHLVFSGELSNPQESTALPEREEAVFAAEVEGDDPPIQVGQGSFGVWCPQ